MLKRVLLTPNLGGMLFGSSLGQVFSDLAPHAGVRGLYKARVPGLSFRVLTLGVGCQDLEASWVSRKPQLTHNLAYR